MSEAEIPKTIGWNIRLEDYFTSTGEKAHCLSWIHKHAAALYSRRTTFIDLPVIVLSGVLGFLSVGSTSMFAGNGTIASMAVGAGSLFVSVLNTVGSYFGWSKRAEGHRIASIHYSKLYRFLTIEMSLPRHERMAPADLLKLTKETYDRLQEISPLLPAESINLFRVKFGNDKYKDISKPEEANGLEKITVFDVPFEDTTSQSPLASVPKIGVPLSRTRSGPPQESYSTEEKGVSSFPAPHFLSTDSPNESQPPPPPP